MVDEISNTGKGEKHKVEAISWCLQFFFHDKSLRSRVQEFSSQESAMASTQPRQLSLEETNGLGNDPALRSGFLCSVPYLWTTESTKLEEMNCSLYCEFPELVLVLYCIQYVQKQENRLCQIRRTVMVPYTYLASVKNDPDS